MSQANEIFNVNLVELAEECKAKYAQNSPFPHIVFKNLFQSDYLDNILNEFPDLSSVNHLNYHNSNEFKFASLGGDNFGLQTTSLFDFLNSSHFLGFLQKLTGIEEPLYGDPYFYGGGLHEIKNKGYLKIHADFNKHPHNKIGSQIKCAHLSEQKLAK